MHTALLVAGKDLRQRLRDRSALLVAFVIPFVLAAVFGLTLSGTGDVTFRFGLVQLDEGESGSHFVREVLPALEREDLVRVRRAATFAEGRELVDRGDVAATFVVPAGFSAAVERGARTRIEVVGNPDRPIATLVARSIAQSYASGLDAVRVAVAAAITAGDRSVPPAELGRRAARLADPVVVADVTAERRELDLNTFYAAGMAVFFVFFTVQFGVPTLLDERRDGTLYRLLAAPVRRTAILGGKALTSVVLGVVSMSVLAVATSLILGAHWGDPLGVALLIVAGVIAATAVAALVTTFARTPDQAGYWLSIVAVVLGMLGGCFFPVYQAGGWLETVSLGTPQAWFLRGLAELAGDEPANAALGPAAAILGFAAVAGALAVARSGRLLER